MILHELRIMRGPNMWSDIQKLLVLKMDYSNITSNDISTICEWQRLNLFISCSPEDFKKQPWHYLSLLISELIKKLQPGLSNTFSAIKVLGKESYYILVEYEQEQTGKEAVYSACDIIELLLSKNNIALEELQEKIKKNYDKHLPGPSTSAIIDAAKSKGIPIRKSVGGYYVFGQGKYQKKISASICENTSDIAVDIASDKEITKQILEEAYIPLPKGILVQNEESIKKLISEIDFPVVVKPLNANQGKGITSNINSERELIIAFQLAKKYSNSIIIEKYILGNDYRFLVIGNKVIAVAHRIPACVVGNGKSTITGLIDQVNADPSRGDGHGKPLTKITIDASTLNILRSKNLTLESVLKQNERLFLKDTANLSTGGTAIDVTDEVHPDNIMLAERVAALIGLDICGIDIIAPDVSSPIYENNGAVLEVNAAPGLRMHVSPSYGKARNVGDPIIELLFPNEAKFRVPIVAVTGTNGKTTTTRLMAHVASVQGHHVGFTTTDGIYLNTKRIFKGDCSGPNSANIILQEPSVDFAVLECARGGIIRSGLAFNQCDIAIVTNVAADHLGLKDINTVEDLAKVKAVVPRSVNPAGYAILNAADELVYNMRKGLKCKVALFCLDFNNPGIMEHVMASGIAAVLNQYNDIIILKHNEQIKICNVSEIPLTMNGKATFMIENILPVVLASYLLNFPIENIKSALLGFSASEEQTPGRLNKFEINGVNVILDYAHNPHGLKALGTYLNNLNTNVTGIVAGVGDRRDEDLKEVGRIAAKMYNSVIIRSDRDTRGRTSEEIAALVVAGLTEVDPTYNYKIIDDSEVALIYALNNSAKGSYVVISADDTNDTLDLIHKLEANYNNIIA